MLNLIDSEQKTAYTYTALTILFWSTVATAFKISLKHVDSPFQLVFYSSLIAVCILSLLLYLRGNIDKIFEMQSKDWKNSAILGFLNPFVYYIILFTAYDRLLAQIAQPINVIWAVMIVLLSTPLLNQKIGIKRIGAILISFLGVVLVSSKGNFKSFQNTDLLGVTLAFSSSIIFALYWIFNMKDSRARLVKLLVNYLFGTFYLFLAGLMGLFQLSIPLQGLLGSTYIGLFEMGLTSYVWLKALETSGTTAKISNYLYLYPFISLIFIHFILGEKILITSFFGLIFIIFGILIQENIKN